MGNTPRVKQIERTDTYDIHEVWVDVPATATLREAQRAMTLAGDILINLEAIERVEYDPDTQEGLYRIRRRHDPRP